MKNLQEDSLQASTRTAEFSSLSIILVSAYIAAQMLSDITSTKIGSLFGLAVDMGTFIYPITFTLRDLIHKQLGKQKARVIIITAAVVNLLMAAYLWFTAWFPSDPGFVWHEAFAGIFALAPRIVIASIIAEIASELLDTEVYHWFVTKITSRKQWARVLVSNSMSVPVDSVVFALAAFAFDLPWETVAGIILANIILKMIVTFASIPMIYLVPEKNSQK